jgi:hypothetical protein
VINISLWELIAIIVVLITVGVLIRRVTDRR